MEKCGQIAKTQKGARMYARVPSSVRNISDLFKDIVSSSVVGKHYLALNMLFAYFLFEFDSVSDMIRNTTWTSSPSHFLDFLDKMPSSRFLRRTQKSILRTYNGSFDPKDFILALDDTDNPKYAKMANCSRFRTSKGQFFGQKVIVLVLVDISQNFALPLAFDFIKPKKSKDHIKGLDVGLKLVKDSVETGFKGVPLVCDSWFDSVEFAQKLEEIGVTYIWEVKSNRKTSISNSRHDSWKPIRDAFNSLTKKRVTNRLKKEPKYIAERFLKIRKWPKFLKVIAVYNFPSSKKAFAYYASSDCSISGAKIWEYSRARWAIEKLFRDVKQNLNFGNLASNKKVKCDLAVEIPLVLVVMIRLYPDKFGCKTGMTIGEVVRQIKKEEAMKTFQAIKRDKQRVIIDQILSRNQNSIKKPRITACGEKLAA